jgi:hypothetical protein
VPPTGSADESAFGAIRGKEFIEDPTKEALARGVACRDVVKDWYLNLSAIRLERFGGRRTEWSGFERRLPRSKRDKVLGSRRS